MKIKSDKESVLPLTNPSMQLLINTRITVGIGEENPHMFANSSKGYLRAWDVLKEDCRAAKLVNPDAIKTTTMRKYITTVAQVVSMKKEEIDLLTKHLGHDLKVQGNFHCQSTVVV